MDLYRFIMDSSLYCLQSRSFTIEALELLSSFTDTSQRPNFRPLLDFLRSLLRMFELHLPDPLAQLATQELWKATIPVSYNSSDNYVFEMH